MKRMGAPLVVAVGLTLGLSACEQADKLGGQIQDRVAEGVDAAQEALSQAGDAISGSTRSSYEQVRSGVEQLQAGLADAADQTGDQARETYQDLLAKAEALRQAGRRGDRRGEGRGPRRLGVDPGGPAGPRVADPGSGGRPLGPGPPAARSPISYPPGGLSSERVGILDNEAGAPG